MDAMSAYIDTDTMPKQIGKVGFPEERGEWLGMRNSLKPENRVETGGRDGR